MSLVGLTSVHSVTAYPLTATQNAVMGTTFSRGTAAVKQCRVSELDASEIAKYMARGMRVDYELYFSTDPAINNNYEIDWVDDGGTTRTIRVDAIYKESDGTGSAKLWVVAGHLETSRKST